MLKMFRKIGLLLDARQKRKMVWLVFLMLIGALLESQTREKFTANPWIRDVFESRGERVPLPTNLEPYMN